MAAGSGLSPFDASSLRQRIISGTLWSAVETWGRQAITFVLFAVLARLVGPEAYGLMALALVVPLVAQVPITRGFPEALVQRAEIDELHLSSVFWLLTAVGLIIAGVIWLSAGAIAAVFDRPDMTALVRWTSAIVVLNSISAVPVAVLRRAVRFRRLAIRSLAGTIVGGLVGIVMAMRGFGVWSLVGFQIVKSAVEIVAVLFGNQWRPKLAFSWPHCRQMSSFAGNIVSQSFLAVLVDEIPKLLIGYFLGPYPLGVYSLSRRVLDFISELIINPLFAVCGPSFARLQTDRRRLDNLFDTSVRLTALAAFPAFVGMASIAPVAVPLIFGARWSAAATIVQILMLSGLARSVTAFSGATLLALGHSRRALQLDIAHAALATTAIALAAPLGLTAAVSAQVATAVLMVPVGLVVLWRGDGLDVKRPLAAYPGLAGAAALVFGAVTVWWANAAAWFAPPVLLASAVAIGAVTYVMAIVVLAPETLWNGLRAAQGVFKAQASGQRS